MNNRPTILKTLRTLTPSRTCTYAEALQVAERQATHLVKLLDAGSEGIQDRHLAALPRIRIAYEALPVSGMSHWNGKDWIICINQSDSPARQRFTLLHEFKHIIDHGATGRLYTGSTGRKGAATPAQQSERAADYFAGCALVPKPALKRAWGGGLQQLDVLADHFGVSEAAMQVRLDQTGLSRETDPEPEPTIRARCQRPIWTPRWQPQRFAIQRPHYGRR